FAVFRAAQAGARHRAGGRESLAVAVVSERALLSALALVIGLLPSSGAFAQAKNPVTIEIDAAAAGTSLKPVWAYFGYDEANYTTLPEARELLRTLATLQQGPVHVRTHF